jgi:NADH-quinone oxidoreductase subunit E
VSVRRLAPPEVQPKSFAFSSENASWAERQIAKFPEGRQASAVIPLLWRAQEQEGWVSEAAIVVIAGMLGMPKIRVLEVATFYTMFNLEPVGRHFVQLCGTVPCHLRGAPELKEVCKRVIGAERHVTADGALSWLEVECLGACTNAPMVQINADYYEDLTPQKLEWILGELRAGRVPPPGPQNGRQFSAPLGGDTTLIEPGLYDRPAVSTTSADTAAAIEDVGAKRPTVGASQREQPAPNADVATAGRAEGKAPGDAAPADSAAPTAQPAGEPTLPTAAGAVPASQVGGTAETDATLMKGPHPPQGGDVARGAPARSPDPVAEAMVDPVGSEREALAKAEEAAIAAKLAELPKGASAEDKANAVGIRPAGLAEARSGAKDKLQRIRGIGPVNEGKLNGLGIFHFDQIGAWTREEIRWVGTYLAFPGRIDREDWVGQAKTLASGADTDFSKRVDKGHVPTSKA